MNVINNIKEFCLTINNRELATYIWLSAFIIVILSVKSIRSSIGDIAKIMFSGQILYSLITMIIYIILMIYIMYCLGFWDVTLLKDSIVWFIGVGMIMFVNASKAAKDEYYFKEIVKDNIKLTIIVEFIINLYVFSLPVELFLLPIITFLILMQVVSQQDVKYKSVEKVITNIIGILGLIIIAHAIYKLFTNFESLATLDNLRSFLFPIILTFAYIPFVYFMALYIIYEEFFVRISNAYRHQILLGKYVKWKIFKTSLFSLSKTRKLTKEVHPYILNTRKKFDAGISKINFS